jgi:hypothetical protein
MKTGFDNYPYVKPPKVYRKFGYKENLCNISPN